MKKLKVPIFCISVFFLLKLKKFRKIIIKFGFLCLYWIAKCILLKSVAHFWQLGLGSWFSACLAFILVLWRAVFMVPLFYCWLASRVFLSLLFCSSLRLYGAELGVVWTCCNDLWTCCLNIIVLLFFSSLGTHFIYT